MRPAGTSLAREGGVDAKRLRALDHGGAVGSRPHGSLQDASHAVGPRTVGGGSRPSPCASICSRARLAGMRRRTVVPFASRRDMLSPSLPDSTTWRGSFRRANELDRPGNRP